MDEYRNQDCYSHSQTIDDIAELRKENEKIKNELAEVKKAIRDFRKFEETFIDNYKKYHKTLWQRIVAFFKGE